MTLLRRAQLYVPGSSSKFLHKSIGLKVDSLALDLEDSVTPSLKPAARENICQILNLPRTQSAQISELSVRINSVSSGLAEDDLSTVLSCNGAATNLDTLVIPKVNSAKDIVFVTDMIAHHLPTRDRPIKLIALIESARAIVDLSSICTAAKNLSGLTFAAEDFALDLGITRTPDLSEFLYARSAIVTAAKAFGLDSALDLVTTAYRGDKGTETLRKESENGKRLGFTGKQVIHPDQVDIVQQVFGPAEDEVEWAVKVCIADEKADKQGRGAWTLDGKMIDAPVAGKARAIVQLAGQCEYDINGLRDKHRHVEPE
ncbi:beta subunit of citrate lyase [Piedraia hortae CBS 480.64]|uniref:Beta subunit of citrate lyase n=1 Tax=Piedraia hortae CBS 480.64 TaxID=1314780 RepID=A0A6A7C7R0_9PEZI|nr:beta subunit of citrate lyase [Piedraia hortae CBS 480.64]